MSLILCRGHMSWYTSIGALCRRYSLEYLNRTYRMAYLNVSSMQKICSLVYFNMRLLSYIAWSTPAWALSSQVHVFHFVTTTKLHQMYGYVTVEHVYKKTCNALMGFDPGTAHIVIKPMIYQLSLKGDLHKHNKQRVIMNPPT